MVFNLAIAFIIAIVLAGFFLMRRTAFKDEVIRQSNVEPHNNLDQKNVVIENMISGVLVMITIAAAVLVAYAMMHH